MELDEPEKMVVEEEEGVVDLELEEEPAEEQLADAGALEPELATEPAMETEDGGFAEEEDIADEEPPLEEKAEAVEEKLDLEEPASEEMDEEDVAAFLNQVAEEDPEAADDEESLGDFFKQFDN